MQRNVIERVKGSEEEKECTKRWFIALGKVMTGIVSALGGDVDRFSESIEYPPYLCYNGHRLV